MFSETSSYDDDARVNFATSTLNETALPALPIPRILLHH